MDVLYESRSCVRYEQIRDDLEVRVRSEVGLRSLPRLAGVHPVDLCRGLRVR